MIRFEIKKNFCQALIVDDVQCMKKCVNDFCSLHGPEKYDRVKFLYKEIAVKQRKFLKYVEKERKKNNIRHRKCMERLDLIRYNKQKGLLKSDAYKEETQQKNIAYMSYESDEESVKVSTQYYIPSDYEEDDESTEQDDLFMSNDSFESAVTTPESFDEKPSVIIWKEVGLPEQEPQDPEIVSLMKKLEKECSKVELRTYNDTNNLDSHRLGRIKQLYKYEMNQKAEIYNGLIRMLSNYTSTDEIDLNWVRNEAKVAISILMKNTDKNVKTFATVRKSKPLSAYY